MAKENKSEKIEREYVIPLRRKYKHVPIYKKTPKAIKTIKEFVARHMKVYDRDLNKIRLDKYLNEQMWIRGIKNPIHKIKVKCVKEGDIVRVFAVELNKNINFKKQREEKIEEEGKKVADKKKSEKVEEEKKEENAKTPEEAKAIEEKKASVIEAGKEMEKAQAKMHKHEASAKQKQPKHQVRMALEK